MVRTYVDSISPAFVVAYRFVHSDRTFLPVIICSTSVPILSMLHGMPEKLIGIFSAHVLIDHAGYKACLPTIYLEPPAVDPVYIPVHDNIINYKNLRIVISYFFAMISQSYFLITAGSTLLESARSSLRINSSLFPYL